NTLAKLNLDHAAQRRAVRLFGAAAALREASGVALAPADLEELDQDLAAARAALGEAAVEQAWGEGRAMPLAELIAEALASYAPGVQLRLGSRTDPRAADALRQREHLDRVGSAADRGDLGVAPGAVVVADQGLRRRGDEQAGAERLV